MLEYETYGTMVVYHLEYENVPVNDEFYKSYSFNTALFLPDKDRQHKSIKYDLCLYRPYTFAIDRKTGEFLNKNVRITKIERMSLREYLEKVERI